MPYRLAIQCRDAVTGKTCDFLYDDSMIAKAACTKIFPDLHAFFTWANEQGLEEYMPPGENNPYMKAWRSKPNLNKNPNINTKESVRWKL